MASTYTGLGTEQIATGEKINIWGDALNNSVFALFVQAISGVVAVEVDGDTVLTIPNGSLADGRSAVLVLLPGAATAEATFTVPAVPKTWWVRNTSLYPVTFTCGGDAATVRANSWVMIYSDGTDIVNPEMGIDQLKPLTGDFSLNGKKITNLAPGTTSTDAATYGQVAAIAGAADTAVAAAATAVAALAAINSKFTVSTAAPSGGNDGDVWFRIA